MASPIIHDLPGRRQKTYEYVLPMREPDFCAEHGNLLSPWFRRYVDASLLEIRAILADDWKAFGDPTVLKFSDYLLALTPKSIVLHDTRIWLALANCDGPSAMMIHEPRTLSKSELAFVRGFGVEALEAFSTHFYDAFECVTPDVNGLAMYAEPMDSPEYGDWRHGMYLYYVCCGDMIMLARDGRVGRCFHELAWDDPSDVNGAQTEVAGSFEEFVDLYIAYLKSEEEDRKASHFW